ncbi:unnamed protein product [Dovyalis caffra]|uniref:Uncharacterized protein n=1 Tax=Dovyalis caffra TaxID=77055 RepID=A0AAV1QQ73_9ROSI|nr:unnamed protein product [Dovyalis caffra]
MLERDLISSSEGRDLQQVKGLKDVVICNSEGCDLGSRDIIFLGREEAAASAISQGGSDTKSILMLLFKDQQLVSVQAARMLSEEFASANHLETYSSVYEKAKNHTASWLGRLASGPSPKGPGH